MLALGLVLAPSAFSATANTSSASTPEAVVMGGDSHYFPYQFVDDGGRATGFDVELLRAVAQHAGFQARVELGNWSRHRHALRRGAVDVVPMFVSSARRQLYLFSTPFLYRYHMLFGYRDSEYVDSLQDLAGHRVAVQYDGLAWEALRHIDGIAIVPTRVEAAAIDRVRQQQAEYALVPVNIGYIAMMRNRDHGIVALSPPLLKFPYAFAVTRGRPELVKRINRGLAEVKEDGTYDRLYLHWLANLKPTASSFRHGLAIGALVGVPLLVLVGVVLWWLRQLRRQAASQQDRADQEARRRHVLEREAEYLAYNDVDTGLPNHHGLMAALGVAVKRARRAGSGCALVRIDVLELDTLRAAAGDATELELLRAIAKRLENLPSARAAARVGHGRFALLAQPVADLAAARELATAALDVVRSGVELRDLQVMQHCCAGYALYPEHAESAQGLVRAASLACTAARRHGGGCHAYQMALEPAPRDLTLLSDLCQAIHSHGLDCVAQPKIELTSGHMAGAEMLVRWQHPRYGDLAPDEFIPVAESTGVIGEITEYMLHAVAHSRAQWAQMCTPFHLAINASVNDFSDSDLVATIIAVARELPVALVLEITESSLLRDSEAVLAALTRLRRVGVQVSLDDFGTGYSSLTYLKRMAPEEIKIDRSFVTGLLSSEPDRAIVHAAIDLGHSLGARVCAEGVEDAAVLEWLRQAGCDLAQGYAIARPMPVAELPHWRFATTMR